MKAKNGEEYESAIAGVSVDTLNEIELRKRLKSAEVRAEEAEAKLSKYLHAVGEDERKDKDTIADLLESNRELTEARDTLRAAVLGAAAIAAQLEQERDEARRELAEARDTIQDLTL